MSSRVRALLAAAFLAGAAFTAAPASAVCDPTLYELTGWCSYCSPVGIVYNAADDALHDKLPPLDCAA